MKYLIRLHDARKVTINSDTFRVKDGVIVFKNFFRDDKGFMVKGAKSYVAAFPSSEVQSVIQTDED